MRVRICVTHILVCISKKVEVSQKKKGILNNFFPFKHGTRGIKISSSEIVLK